MKKLLSSLLILSMLLGNPRDSHAVVALPAAALAAATALAVVGAGAYYLDDSVNFQPVADFMTQSAKLSYFTINAALKTVHAVTQSVTAVMGWQDLVDMVNANAASFPLLSSIINPSISPSAYPVGTVIQDIYGSRVKTTGTGYAASNSCTTTPPNNSYYPSYSAGTLTIGWVAGSHACPSGGSPYSLYRYPAAVTSDPVTPLASGPLPLSSVPSAFAAKQDDAATDEEVKRLMQLGAAGGIVGYRTPTLDKLSPVPPDAVSLEQARAAESAFAQEQAAIDALTAAQSHAAQTAAAAAADPTNADLANQASAATAAVAVAAAAAAAAKAASDAAASDASDSAAPVEPPPELLKFDWSAARRLMGQLETAWPFNLLLSLGGLFSPLVSSPQAPVFDLPVWGGNSVHIDLSPFDTLASICRWFFALLLTVTGIMLVVRWYRG